MNFGVESFQPKGSMDFDSNVLDVNTKEGMYLRALNVSTINLTGQQDRAAFNVLGNTLAFVLPTIAPQNKIYAITFSSITVGNVLCIQFLNLNGSEFYTNVVASYTVISGDTLATITTNFGSAITSALTSGGFTSTIVTSTPGTVTIEIATSVSPSRAVGFDYNIVEYSTNTEPMIITTAQEGWDKLASGLCIPTGSYDWFGDLFIISSTVGLDPATYNVVGSEVSSQGFVNINVAGDVTQAVTLSNDFYVVVQGVEGTIEANGSWLCTAASFNVISPGNTTFTLFNSTYANAWTSGGTLTINVNGFMNITVGQYTPSTQTWTTTQLLQTKQINARYIHPERKVLADFDNDILNFYFTDKNDVPRIFSYQGAYMANGAIEYYNPIGLYTYEGINEEMGLFVNVPTAVITNAELINSGGGILSGNWRYGVRFLDSVGTPTGIGVLSPPVNIFSANITSPSTIVGTPGAQTSNQIVLTINDIPENTFPFIQLIGVQYVGVSETAYIIKQVSIPANATTMMITHTGLEMYINFTDSLSLSSITYLTAGDLSITSNTLLMADLTGQEIADWSAYFQSWTHTLNVGSGLLSPVGDDINGFTYGEYQDPTSLFQYASHMLNETYRYAGVVEFKNGSFSPPYWIDDIRFDNFTTNRASPFAGGDTRRIGNNISSFDLSQSSESVEAQDINSYVFYPTFSSATGGDIDMNYLINGIPINQLAQRIHIFRVDNTLGGYNEVLGCGLTVRHVGGTLGSSPANQITGVGGSPSNYLFENPFLVNSVGQIFGLPPVSLGLNSYTNLFGGSTDGVWEYGVWDNAGVFSAALINGSTPHSGSFYCPDWIYGQSNINLLTGDTIFNYGQPDWYIGVTGGATPIGDMDSITDNTQGTLACIFSGVEFRLSGATHVTLDPWTETSTVNPSYPINLPIAALTSISQYNTSPYPILSNAVYFCPTWEFAYRSGSGSPTYEWSTPAHLWVYLNGTPNVFTNTNLGGSPTYADDIGMYYCQYYRNLGSVDATSTGVSKFGAINTGIYIPTGSFIDCDTQGTVNVFGGDTFTQKSFLKIQVPMPDTNSGAPSTQDTGGGTVAVFLCQNRTQYNMRDGSDGQYPFPTPQSNWINDTTDSSYESGYDIGYTPRNIDDELIAFNPNLAYPTDYRDRKIFSMTKPQGSQENFYRIFPPLNFDDDSSDSGAITSIFNVQGELHGLLEADFERYFYNERATLQTQDASSTSSIAFGSDAPFSRPAISLSDVGCSNIFSIIQGVGIKGEDVVAYLDTITKNVMLYSRNGLRTISIERLARSWFYNNLEFVTGDIPVLGNAISSVFDAKTKSFIWSVFNNVNAAEWNDFTSYLTGQYVSYGTTFEGFAISYIAIRDNFNETPGTNSAWQLVVNAYTIVYNLYVDGFTYFLTPKPYFYIPYRDTYLTAYPNITYNGMYMSDTGVACNWYDIMGVGQQENGYIQWVYNDINVQDKRFMAISVDTELVPYTMNFETSLHESYLLSTDFMADRDSWISPIKNDTLTSPDSTPYNRSSYLFGRYLETELIFQFGQQQSMWAANLKYSPQSRLLNK